VCRNVIARAPGTRTHTYARACLALALTVEGMSDEAIAVSEGLLTAADATHNPFVASMALLAYGFAYRDADPDRALGALRRGLVIARDSGNRFIESHLAVGLSRLAATHGDPLDAFEFLTVAIRNFYDSGSFSIMASPLAVLAAFFDRLGHHQPAATISGFALDPPHTDRLPRDQHHHRPPPRSARRPGLRSARPQGRGDDHCRHGGVRLRADRPGPSEPRDRG
jgi:hypothetical protein